MISTIQRRTDACDIKRTGVVRSVDIDGLVQREGPVG